MPHWLAAGRSTPSGESGLYAEIVMDEKGRKHAALRELSDADRMYRAAFRELATAPRLSPSSFASLRVAVRRLEEVVRHLDENARRDEESP